MTAAHCWSKAAIRRLQLEKKEESEASSRKRAPGPRQGAAQALIPQSQMENKRESAWFFFFLSLFPSLSPFVFLLVLPHSGVFSLFAGSLLVPLQLSLLSPPPVPPAGHNDDEEDDHSSDAASDG